MEHFVAKEDEIKGVIIGGQHKFKKDDWKELMKGSPAKLKGDEPDFSEEGWARRRPKK